MEAVKVVLEGAIAIAGMALIALTLGVLFPYCRTETEKGIQKTDSLILSMVNGLTNKPDDSVLESICKLRRRKAHMQKDNQNFFFLFLIAAVCLIIVGILPILGFNEIYSTIIKASLSWLFLFCFSGGIFFIGRMFLELQRIDKDKV